MPPQMFSGALKAHACYGELTYLPLYHTNYVHDVDGCPSQQAVPDLIDTNLQVVIVFHHCKKVAYYDAVHQTLHLQDTGAPVSIASCAVTPLTLHAFSTEAVVDVERRLGIVFTDAVDATWTCPSLVTTRVLVLQAEVNHGMDAVLANVEALFRRLTDEEDAQHPTDRMVTRGRHLNLWADCIYHAIFFDAPVSVLQALLHWGGAPAEHATRYPCALEMTYAKLAAAQEPLGALDHDTLAFHLRHSVHMYDGMSSLFDTNDRKLLEARLHGWTTSARALFVTACLAMA